MLRRSKEVLKNLTVAAALLLSLDAVVRQDKSLAHAVFMALNAESSTVHAQGSIPQPPELPVDTIPGIPPIDITPTPVTGPHIDRLEVLVVDVNGEKVTDARVMAHTDFPENSVETGTFTDGGGTFAITSNGGPMAVEITGSTISTLTHQVDVGSENTLAGISIGKTGEITATMALTTTNPEISDAIASTDSSVDVLTQVSTDSLKISYPDNSAVEVTDLEGDSTIVITPDVIASRTGAEASKEVTVFVAPDSDGYTVHIKKDDTEVTYRGENSETNSSLTFTPDELINQGELNIQVDSDGDGISDSTVTIEVPKEETHLYGSYLPLIVQ